MEGGDTGVGAEHAGGDDALIDDGPQLIGRIVRESRQVAGHEIPGPVLAEDHLGRHFAGHGDHDRPSGVAGFVDGHGERIVTQVGKL